MTVYNDLDEEILPDCLSDEDLDALESIEREKTATASPAFDAPVVSDDESYAPAPVKIVKATDEELSALVKDITTAYPDIVDVSPSAHWSLPLIAILQTIDYTPRRGMIFDGKHFKGLDRVGHIGYVNGHISNLALKDIRENVDIWIKEHPIMPSRKVEIMETEGGGLAYQATQVQIEKSESATQEGWASW